MSRLFHRRELDIKPEKKKSRGKGKKGGGAKHIRSSAMAVSLAIHALLIVGALSVVAVTVIMKDDTAFEAKTVNRPKMPLRKLQVPVNTKKPPRQPKLRKQIVATPKINKIPDIKMPEIIGVKGGLGGAAGGLGGAGVVGFSMPDIKLFGVKGKGEKIFIILDSSSSMMVDEMGGMLAYALIKSEVVKLLRGLNGTVLFNIAVYGDRQAYTLFLNLIPASSSNVSKVEDWLRPLNAFHSDMGGGDYGPRTLGAGSLIIGDDLVVAPLKRLQGWTLPALLAMKQQADTIFLLTQGWGGLFHTVASAKAWSPSKQAKYEEILVRAKRKHAEENDERLARGQPPRVFDHPHKMVLAYFPGTEKPPSPERYLYTPEDLLSAMETTREKWAPEQMAGSGVGKMKSESFTFNVIQFVPAHSDEKQRNVESFKRLAGRTRGAFNTVAGLEAIESYVK